jgi:hypothetical protein
MQFKTGNIAMIAFNVFLRDEKGKAWWPTACAKVDTLALVMAEPIDQNTTPLQEILTADGLHGWIITVALKELKV